MIVKYILYKEENFDENINNDKAKELIRVIKNVDTVSSAKNVEDVLPIIKKLKLTHQHLSQELQKKAEVSHFVKLGHILQYKLSGLECCFAFHGGTRCFESFA